jgi:8-oxo-dGTP pyrophosphatase MutT (NUDIX family)
VSGAASSSSERGGTSSGDGTATPTRSAKGDTTNAAAQKTSRRKGQKQSQKRGQQRQKQRGTSAKSTRKTTGRKTSNRKNSKRKATGRKRRGAPTKREISAGGVVYRRDGDEIEVVLASRRTRRGELAWGLAKGGIEEDESAEDAAVREVREETGLHAEIEASLGETRYFYVWEDVRIRKTVHFFLMRHTGGNIEDRDDEMEEIRWFPLERALKRAAYRGERDVLGRAAEILT